MRAARAQQTAGSMPDSIQGVQRSQRVRALLPPAGRVRSLSAPAPTPLWASRRRGWRCTRGEGARCRCPAAAGGPREVKRHSEWREGSATASTAGRFAAKQPCGGLHHSGCASCCAPWPQALGRTRPPPPTLRRPHTPRLEALNSPARRRRLTAGPTPAARTPESEQRGEQGRDSGVRIPEAALPEAQDAASQRGTPARAASRPVRPPLPTPHLPHQHTHLAQVPPLVQGASPLVVLLPGSARGSAAGAALAVQPPDLGAHLAGRGVKVDGWAAGRTPGRAAALLPARQATNPSVLHACPQSRAG